MSRHADRSSRREFQTISAPSAAVGLFPAAVVATGPAEQPVDRLLTLQSAIARVVHRATTLGSLRFRLPNPRSLITLPR